MFLAGAQANATSMLTQLNANLQTFNMDAASPLAQRDIRFGTIKIDFAHQEVTLILNPAFRCNAPAGAMCMMVMPQPVEVTLPLKSVTTDGCNAIVYEAEVNYLPVDGNGKFLTVIDNSNNYCEMYPLHMTEVRFREAGGGRGNFYDYQHFMTSDQILK